MHGLRDNSTRSKNARQRFVIRRSVAPEVMPAVDRQAAELILARLVAQAYAADHPQLFRCQNNLDSGSSPAARADAVAPAARGDDSEQSWSMERHDNTQNTGNK